MIGWIALARRFWPIILGVVMLSILAFGILKAVRVGEELATLRAENAALRDHVELLAANEVAAEHGGQRLCQFRLADADLSLEQQRLAELHGQQEGRGEAAVGDVPLLSQLLDQGGDGQVLEGCRHGLSDPLR